MDVSDASNLAAKFLFLSFTSIFVATFFASPSSPTKSSGTKSSSLSSSSLPSVSLYTLLFSLAQLLPLLCLLFRALRPLPSASSDAFVEFASSPDFVISRFFFVLFECLLFLSFFALSVLDNLE